MKKILLLGFLLNTILFSGCVKILNDELKTKEVKMVLNAAISPDSMFTVNISKTIHIFEDESADNLPFIDSAKVQLFENGNYLFDLQNIGAGYYINPQFFPQTGKEYKVNVSYGSLKPIECKTTIPAVTPIKSFDTLSVTTMDEYGGNHVQLIGELTYNDAPDKSNYYQLSCKVTYLDPNNNTYTYDQGLWPTDDNERFFDGYNNGKLLWNDKLTNGKEVSFKFVYYDTYEYGKKSNRSEESARFVFYFKSISKEYYTYLKSIDVYYETGEGDNPFSEPVVIYSNVENGYGIMGGYTQDTTSVKLVFNSGEKGGAK
jgi:hypothetical protein